MPGVLKLRGATFRPTVARPYDWALPTPGVVHAQDVSSNYRHVRCRRRDVLVHLACKRRRLRECLREVHRAGCEHRNQECDGRRSAKARCRAPSSRRRAPRRGGASTAGEPTTGRSEHRISDGHRIQRRHHDGDAVREHRELRQPRLVDGRRGRIALIRVSPVDAHRRQHVSAAALALRIQQRPRTDLRSRL